MGGEALRERSRTKDASKSIQLNYELELLLKTDLPTVYQHAKANG